MKNHNKRYWILSIAAFLCGLLIGGCNPFPDTVEPPTMMPTPAPQATASPTTEPPTMTPTPARQATATATVEPSIAAPTPILDLQTYGSLLYLDGRSVWEGLGLASDRLVVELPFEKVYAAALMDNNLWVLADDQLAAVNLTSGMVETVAEIELSDYWGGQLLVLWNCQSVAYAAGVDDDSNLLGRSTRVGLYDLRTQQIHRLAKLEGDVSLLGAPPEEDSLYAVRTGGDGGFGRVLTISLEDGTTATKIELLRAGVGTVTMSPDKRWVAVTDADWSQPKHYITIYNLAKPEVPPATVDLPRKPSHARGLKWASDSQHLYFVLWPGSWAAWLSAQPQKQTYGLWRADIHSGEVEEITSATQVDHYPVAVSPDGRAVLIGNTTFTLVDVQTGAERSLDLPQGARILLWRIPDAQ